MKFLKYIIVFLCVFFVGFLFYSYQIDTPISKAENTKDTLEISKGESLQNIATDLENKGIIRSAFWMRVYFKVHNLSQNIIADEFFVSSSMNIKTISKIITTKNDNEVKLRIIEGWNLNQIGEYLEGKQICTKENWLSLVKNYNSDYGFLKDKKNSSLEGYLFPDTYIVYKDTGCEDLLKKMLNNLNNKLSSQMISDIALQKKSVFEIITMASIIEKEVTSVKDMKIVSGIFWNRIENKQALESCATLAYILGENKDQYSYKDTQIDSPYNTYRNRGLTPGPISNPGLNAINAAIYPEDTNYNYFLTAKSGETIYSRTFEEHKINKAKYLK